MATLDAYLGLQSSSATPECAATSQEIRDRGSIFIANILPANTVKEARAAISHVRNVIHGSKPATHEVSAWRCMVLKPGHTGLGGPDDFDLKSGSEDDGEQHAGAKVLKVMQDEGIIDAVVVVSRWYGGVMLGPVRFTHFETCTREVCRAFRLTEEMAALVSTLSSLDDILATLRAEYPLIISKDSSQPGTSSSERRTPDYSALKQSLDISKVKRLIAARENSIKTVKNALREKRESTVTTSG
ncbi:ribosomal protein S5 domain 2-like protein [Wolfiporia cocos MD-104 SS10]|uniref:Ribosomal protein S5 domain 2-like protein n=1 Tax=Wolfiporia cocos (strain MD-104) TaxID=742152 RepID=A0A2H3J0N8_WOLCO|nr:ribosomal protein S5 domain 2-like protein [Wolfiporia cocos MD-104 SS10]